MTLPGYPPLVRALLEAAAYAHPVVEPQVVETHISWVILTGDWAYKLKKPVDLGFLDFSTLERRRHFCDEELRINRRTAPDIYDAVVPVAFDGRRACVGGQPAAEYAVRMRQFAHAARLDRRLQAGELGREHMAPLAAVIAAFHGSLPPRSPAESAGEASRAAKPARNNFLHLDASGFGDTALQQLAVVEDWTLQQAAALAGAFAERALGGAVRECHGDLHLENLLYQDGRFVPFDALEFDPELRWIDVANDIAFLGMDLMARERSDLAHALLSAWLEATGDYGSLSVLRFYLVYRSMVRAVVLSLRQRQAGAPGEGSFRRGAERYVDLAAERVDTPPATLYLMHGLAGSGKTWISERLVAGLHALRVRSDLERKRLRGLAPGRAGRGRLDQGLYAREVTERTYGVLREACETGLRAGFDMIADATFLRRDDRAGFLELARSLGVRACILECSAPPEVLRERVQRRQREARDASDADLAVLERQQDVLEPLSSAERALGVTLDSREPESRWLQRIAAAG